VFKKPAIMVFLAVTLAALAFNFFHPFDIQVPHISLAAEEVTRVGPLRITNTLLASWVTMLVLIVVAFLATRNMRLVPRGLQNLIEYVVETLYNFVESIAGASNTALVFPTVATLFLFIIVSNWMGLLPGYLSVVIRRAAEHGDEVEKIPLLRSAATDLNTTLALAVASVVMSQVYGVIVVGFPHYFLRFFNIRRYIAFFRGLTGRGPRTGVDALLFGIIDLFIGVLELFDEFTKVMSFGFRLFGNIFAGEVLLGVMVFLLPFVASLPFLGLELFVGFIQAFVFAVLTAAFIAQATVVHHGAEAEAHEEHEALRPEPAVAVSQGS
jgi:F-type H+-transporting ATPase subunit a